MGYMIPTVTHRHAKPFQVDFSAKTARRGGKLAGTDCWFGHIYANEPAIGDHNIFSPIYVGISF